VDELTSPGRVDARRDDKHVLLDDVHAIGGHEAAHCNKQRESVSFESQQQKRVRVSLRCGAISKKLECLSLYNHVIIKSISSAAMTPVCGWCAVCCGEGEGEEVNEDAYPGTSCQRR
jgi:hypothetical protein